VEITTPLNEVLDFAGSLPRFHYALDGEQCIVGFGDTLKFVAVKRSFYSITSQVFLLVRDGCCWHSSVDDVISLAQLPI